MLHHAETTSIRAVFPVTPSLHNQCQEPTPDSLMSMLSVLFTHPEFLQGVRNCLDAYVDMYDEAPLTQEEMLWEVEMNLSHSIAEAEQQNAAAFGDEAPAYLEKLGWVIGTIAKGLTYAERPVLSGTYTTEHIMQAVREEKNAEV